MDTEKEKKKVVRFAIPGTPIGKGRPRFVRATGRTYTPEKTTNYENLVKLYYTQECEGERFPDDAQLMIVVDAYFDIPKSSRKKDIPLMLEGEIRPAKKPDCDNILKAICDALNGIAYKDDAQIVSTLVNKYYGDKPIAIVAIGEI